MTNLTPGPTAGTQRARSLVTGAGYDPMPWDVEELRRRAAAYGPVAVVDLAVDLAAVDLAVVDLGEGTADLGGLFDAVRAGHAVVLTGPGPDDAGEILRVLGAGRGRGASLEEVCRLAREAGLDVRDCAQWRTAYRFVDAEAAAALVQASWWLRPEMVGEGDQGVADQVVGDQVVTATRALESAAGTGPLVATASRWYAVLSRPAADGQLPE